MLDHGKLCGYDLDMWDFFLIIFFYVHVGIFFLMAILDM